ncbi:MAG: hypothetical protein MI921_17455 [Cytophagales bacterium]|nr:hypothetical protein [Cytophagales bacterium]
MRQKYLLLFSFLFGFQITVFSQILQPAKWRYEVSQDNVKVGNKVKVIFKIDLDNAWQLYSNNQKYEIGPIPTEIHFHPNQSYKLIGDLRPINFKKKYDSVWKETIRYFEKQAEFHQLIKVLSTDFLIKGRYRYQVCSIIDSRCITGEGEFKLTDINVRHRTKKKNNRKQMLNDKINQQKSSK